MAKGHLRPVVFCVTCDPGGAAVVAPVRELIEREGLCEVRDLKFDPNDARPVPTLQEACEQLKASGATVVLTGTSRLKQPEKVFIEAAAMLRIPSLSVLDHWTNYRVRFSDPKNNLRFLPDRIAVMDELAKVQMIAEGFPSERIVVTGAPDLERVTSPEARLSPAALRALREKAGAAERDGHFVLFVSEPISQSNDSRSLGYSETDVLASVISALEDVSRKERAAIVLGIRLHPRDRQEKFGQLSSDQIRIFTADGASGRDWVQASDVVVGMRSKLLIEACLLERAVVSIQPGLKTQDTLPTNRTGLSLGVTKREEIVPALQSALLNEDCGSKAQARLELRQAHAGATRRIVDLVYRAGQTRS